MRWLLVLSSNRDYRSAMWILLFSYFWNVKFPDLVVVVEKGTMSFFTHSLYQIVYIKRSTKSSMNAVRTFKIIMRCDENSANLIKFENYLEKEILP